MEILEELQQEVARQITSPPVSPEWLNAVRRLACSRIIQGAILRHSLNTNGRKLIQEVAEKAESEGATTGEEELQVFVSVGQGMLGRVLEPAIRVEMKKYFRPYP